MVVMLFVRGKFLVLPFFLCRTRFTSIFFPPYGFMFAGVILAAAGLSGKKENLDDKVY